MPQDLETDLLFMDQALAYARSAGEAGEVPVGAVLVHDGEVIAGAHNQPIARCDPTAHAEIVVMREAARQVSNYRLTGMHLYVTLEPCAMCAGAMVHARIGRLVYAAADPRAGAAGSVFNVVDSRELNHRVEVSAGTREAESQALLQAFFRARR